MHLQLGEIATFVVSSAEYAQEVMKTHDITFASRPQVEGVAKVITYGCKSISFAPYGEYWRQVRKICVMELLSLKRVQSFRSIGEQETSRLIQWISSKAGTSINLTHEVTSSTCTLNSRLAFSGDESRDQQEFISLMHRILEIASGFTIADLFPSLPFLQLMSGMSSKVKKLHSQFDRILGSIIDEHRKTLAASGTGKCKENEDLVDVLIQYHEQNDLQFSLSIDEIKAVIVDIYIGGSVTSSTVIDWAMAEMIRNPRVMEKAQAEVRQVFDSGASVDETGIPEFKYLKLVIKETMRLHPPVPLLLPRENSERCEINGYVIPAKTRVIVNAWAIGRDSRYWPHEAEKFYPERFLDSPIDYKGTNFEFIPFGAGRRMCPGMTLGLANLELQLSQLLYYFDWKLPDGLMPEGLNMAEDFGASARRTDDLYLIPTPYCPSPACN